MLEHGLEDLRPMGWLGATRWGVVEGLVAD